VGRDRQAEYRGPHGCWYLHCRFQGNRVFDGVRNPPSSIQPQLQQGLAKDIFPNNVLPEPPSLFVADPVAKIPTVCQHQFSVQTRLPWSMMLDAAYVGSLSRHLQDNRNINYVPYGAIAPQNQDPQRLTASPTALFDNNSLDANFLRPAESQSTANDSLFFGIAYTYSKALTTATSDTSSVSVDQFQRLRNYGPL
jgi:hypothetical protein